MLIESYFKLTVLCHKETNQNKTYFNMEKGNDINISYIDLKTGPFIAQKSRKLKQICTKSIKRIFQQKFFLVKLYARVPPEKVLESTIQKWQKYSVLEQKW